MSDHNIGVLYRVAGVVLIAAGLSGELSSYWPLVALGAFAPLVAGGRGKA